MDAVDIVIPNAYTKAIVENELVPVVQPDVNIKKIDESGLELLFTIITMPEVKIKKYTNMNIEKPKAVVTKKDVDEEIKNLKQKYAEIIIKEGPIEKGDTAVIDFKGYKDEEVFEGGTGENFPLEIGSKTFIPGFEEQLIGLKKGDEKKVEVTFPDDYPSPNLKGQGVYFETKIIEVKTRKIPELNDDFFQDLDIENVTNQEELIKYVQEDLKNKKEVEIENKHLDSILEAISKEVEVDIPKEMIEDEIKRMANRFEEQLKMKGISLEQYYELTKTNEDDNHEKFRNEAEMMIKYRLMMEEISNLEKIEVSEEELEEEIKKMTEKYQTDEKELIDIFGGREMIKYDFKMRKTINFLKENN